MIVTKLGYAVEISAGERHTCARLRSGQVRCWGRNEFGQLGDGSTLDKSTPVAVAGVTDAVEIAAGGGHSCARLSTGELTCWGFNRSGQLGDGTTMDSATPVLVKGLRLPACRP